MDATAEYIETRDKLFEEIDINPQSKFAITDGLVKRVHYLEMGIGEPLIVIHGGLSHSTEWFNILKPLADKFHLYVVDRPGHGLTDPIDYRDVDYRESATDFIRSFMDSVGLEQAFFLGNSMGGYFSICFALKYPERVQRLLLIGAPAGLNLWIPPMLRVLGIPGVNRFLMKTIAKPSLTSHKGIYKAILVADVNKLSSTYLEHSYCNQLLPGARVAMSTLLESVLTIKGWRKELYLLDELKGLTMPVHFIWGNKDAFEKPETGLQKVVAIKHYTFDIVQNAGHCPWLDQPEECCSIILKVLEE